MVYKQLDDETEFNRSILNKFSLKLVVVRLRAAAKSVFVKPYKAQQLSDNFPAYLHVHTSFPNQERYL